MTRQGPRKPSSSRTPVSRPRRVAGQGSEPTVEPTAAEVRGAPAAPVLRSEPASLEGSLEAAEAEAPAAPLTDSEPDGGFEARKLAPQPPSVSDSEPDGGFEARRLAPQPPSVEPEPDSGSPGLAALFDSAKATRILVTLVVVLALVAGGLFAWDSLRSDDVAKPSKEPVLISGDDATAAVDAAAKAAETIVSTSWQDYDKQVDEAAGLMTEKFAAQYRETADGAKARIVADKVVVDARVVAQGVVHATRTEVQALVFLNQYVSKDAGDTTYTPYRALVTVIHTDRGWLVSNLDTK